MTTFEVIRQVKDAFENSGLKMSPQAFDGESIPANATDRTFCLLIPDHNGQDDSEDRKSTSSSMLISLDMTIKGVVLHNLASKTIISVIEKSAETFDKIIKAVLKMTLDGSISKVAFVDNTSKQNGEYVMQTMTFKISYLIINS